jgi:hypothetical protein
MREMSKRTCQCRASERRVVGPSCGDMIRPHAKPYHNQKKKKKERKPKLLVLWWDLVVLFYSRRCGIFQL